jgi:hypothetical protein
MAFDNKSYSEGKKGGFMRKGLDYASVLQGQNDREKEARWARDAKERAEKLRKLNNPTPYAFPKNETPPTPILRAPNVPSQNAPVYSTESVNSCTGSSHEVDQRDDLLGSDEASARITLGAILGLGAMMYFHNLEWSTLCWIGGVCFVVGIVLARPILKFVIAILKFVIVSVVGCALIAACFYGFKALRSSNPPAQQPVVATQTIEAPATPTHHRHHLKASKGAKSGSAPQLVFSAAQN